MYKKKTARSTSTILNQPINEATPIPEIELLPADTLNLKIFSLRISDQDLKNFAIKVTFWDYTLMHTIIKSIGARDEEPTEPIAYGSMSYDPSDYEKMCFFSDYPLVAEIQPLEHGQRTLPGVRDETSLDGSSLDKGDWYLEHAKDISCCNVDILPIFTDMKNNQKICIKKRMEPMVPPSALKCKSWDTLPLLTMELTVERNPVFSVEHKILRKANWMKITLVASFNTLVPFELDYVYTAATKAPSQGEDGENVGLVTFCQGYKKPRRFDCTSFYPKWESLRGAYKLFTNEDQKFQIKFEDIQNETQIDLPFYMNRETPFSVPDTVVWGSFHRTLILKGDRWLWKHLRKHKWPFELHIYGKNGGYSFMSYLNLFKLLYSGEQTVRMAVPLRWIDAETMMRQCGCELLLTPLENPPSIITGTLGSTAPHAVRGSRTRLQDSYATSDSTLDRPTGMDDNDAFVVLEIQLGRSLKPVFKPPPILKEDIGAMLTQMELTAPKKRICTGRGQQEHDWQKTVRDAAMSLRKIPYYGPTEFCTFNRQLSETRTRVELTTSCWQDAAIFINNQFVIQQYQHSDEVLEELVMMAHACLMKSASNILLRNDKQKLEIEPALRAARHARQMQDTIHSMEIYLRYAKDHNMLYNPDKSVYMVFESRNSWSDLPPLNLYDTALVKVEELVVDKPRNADYWRELSTVLKDIDIDCARVCLDHAVKLNARHPLTLLSKGAMLFEEDPATVEPFFIALLLFHPTWSKVWAIASVYFYARELFHMAGVTMRVAEQWRHQRCNEDATFLRAWDYELGDWWDPTPILHGMSLYYDAADILLRLRAVSLAEACTARILAETGETPQYYHLVGLCSRLRGNYEEAKCHINLGLEKFGEISYLRSLEAEIQHKLFNFKEAIESFGKVETTATTYTALMCVASEKVHSHSKLLALVQRNPCAYTWMALAEEWLSNAPSPEKTTSNAEVGDLDEEMRTTAQLMKAKSSAIACAIQALKIDRQSGRAWATLGKFTKPKAKRIYCLNMAIISGWTLTQDDFDLAEVSSKHSFCHDVGTALRECRCAMCDRTYI